MTRFFLLFGITFCLMLAFAWLLIFCRQRLRRSRHQLTGMCHHSGGPTCGNCGEEKKEETCARPDHHGGSLPMA